VRLVGLESPGGPKLLNLGLIFLPFSFEVENFWTRQNAVSIRTQTRIRKANRESSKKDAWNEIQTVK
jgi:hypothetical protein